MPGCAIILYGCVFTWFEFLWCVLMVADVVLGCCFDFAVCGCSGFWLVYG